MKWLKVFAALSFGLGVGGYSALSTSAEYGQNALNESLSLSSRAEYIAMADRAKQQATWYGLGALGALGIGGVVGLGLVAERRRAGATPARSSMLPTPPPPTS
jgi:hypothetical protein